MEGASPADAFDDDPPLVGTAPAIKRFPAWQGLDDLFHHRRSAQPGAGLGRGSLRAEKCILLLSYLPLIMVVTTVPIQHTIFLPFPAFYRHNRSPRKATAWQNKETDFLCWQKESTESLVQCAAAVCLA